MPSIYSGAPVPDLHRLPSTWLWSDRAPRTQAVKRIYRMSRRLTLVCHGATSATRQAAFPADEPLEPLGAAKSAALAKRLGSVDAAWTSPALRAVQTAAALGLNARVDPALSDIDLRLWGGRSLAEVEASDAAGLRSWSTDPSAAPHGGESVEHLLGRVRGWLDERASDAGRVVAITHAAVIRAAVVVALEAAPGAFWRIDVEPLGFADLRSRGSRWTFRISSRR